LPPLTAALLTTPCLPLPPRATWQLEAINLCLTVAGPTHNEHLVYALLERPKVFDPLRSHALFADLVVNVDTVMEHFNAGLQGAPAASDDADTVWSVDKVMHQIGQAALEWRSDKLRPLADLKFTYEQEPAPEEFFTPYMWSIVHERAGLGWAAERIALFDAVERPEDAEGDAHQSVPALSSIDIDEGATGD
jgi:hypothetical protein